MRLLVGDIGGTHSRFGIAAPGRPRPDDVFVADDDDHKNFEDAVAAYLDHAAERPDAAAFAMAGPVAGRRARLTNRDWEIDADALARRFGFSQVELLNDFVAQASALPYLDAGEVAQIGPATPVDGMAKAAVGPGTGLGVSAVLPDGAGGWIAASSEGGHVELASVNDREAAVFAVIRKDRGRVSAEFALQGAGLARIHDALATIDGGERSGASPVEVNDLARAGEARAQEAVRLYLGALARFAGDVALTFGALGGAYLCGGIMPKMTDLLDADTFRTAFEAKAPHVAMMRDIATVLVTSPIAGLIGCAAAADRLTGNSKKRL